jgi:hypothetical protein
MRKNEHYTFLLGPVKIKQENETLRNDASNIIMHCSHGHVQEPETRSSGKT